MATFTDYSNTLPDPIFEISTAGASDSTGNAGPGFAKIKFSSNNQIQVSRTISGRGVTASPGYHMWEFSISYNPMTRAEFEPVATFLESKRGRLIPFYVVLPQHAKPRDNNFYAHVSSKMLAVTGASWTGSVATLTFATQTTVPYLGGQRIYVEGITPSGYNGIYTVLSSPAPTTSSVSFTLTTDPGTFIPTDTNSVLPVANINGITLYHTATAGDMIIDIAGHGLTAGKEPLPGDFFNIQDPNDSNHKKVYKVVRVETSTNYKTGTSGPGASTVRRLHIIPPLTRTPSIGSGINFINPKFRVIQKSDTIEYDLDTDNLYQFSLNLEEILP